MDIGPVLDMLMLFCMARRVASSAVLLPTGENNWLKSRVRNNN